jgi:hypothetical protein
MLVRKCEYIFPLATSILARKVFRISYNKPAPQPLAVILFDVRSRNVLHAVKH